ncbi:MAG: hypothetical protein K0A93_08815 [Desulfuromonadaceae bacterium]|nr:hypothetical protein [Desulfuromonadaceae bacterium]
MDFYITVKPFRCRGELVKPGEVLEIPDDIVGQLGDRVERADCYRMLQATTERLNAQSCWPEDFRQRMPPDVRRQIVELERQLDDSISDGDVETTVKKLTEWEIVLLEQLKRQQH